MQREKPSWTRRFLAVVRYEMLRNIRKKMFIGVLLSAFAFATINFALPSIVETAENPYFAVSFSAGSLMFILFAVVTSMHSFSGEYEKGTAVSLLTKPVSRTMVFLGKLTAISIVILAAYAVLYTYTTIGGMLVYGPQTNLHLVPLALIGDVVGTLIWVSIILAAGAISKNSMLTVMMSFGLFVALSLGGGLVAAFSEDIAAVNYLPGGGTSGTMDIAVGQNITIQNVTVNTYSSVATGTNSIGMNMIKYVMYPEAHVNFYHIDYLSMTSLNMTTPERELLYSEPLLLITLRSVGVAFVYIVAFLFVAWYAFKRWQITG
ncbi:MAG: ABC transporter permease subunit [Crenarchaeota archaeon]|nr:ABC transporter permease subunit [Thermoproteota archaeon]